MNILDLITQDELDDAPEDASIAFMQLANAAQTRLTDYIKTLDEREESYLIEEAQYNFMNVVTALAKSYKIEPFASAEVPQYERYNYAEHRQFKADLDHYITQLLVNNSLRGKRDSVEVPPNLKDKIRVYVNELKAAIDKAEFPDSKRASLHKKLIDFEIALEKNRLSYMDVTKIAFTILAVPGSMWASYDVVKKLTTNVMQVVGEAKELDDENRKLPLVEPPAVLLPPRKDNQNPVKNIKPGGDLDDEIPF
ncbi:MAG: hypothetical protein OQK24_10210 [Magnetovibrio sp.]|nr:hypothetical protein [Magnetovibrio sp.]